MKTAAPSPRRIAVLGAESTGKSTLAAALGAQLNAVLVSEYLREFCQHHGRAPLAHEQAAIAAEQIHREQAAMARASAQQRQWVICDPGPLMTAVYSQYYFADSTLLPQALAWQRGYAATLVCQPDIAWQADGFMRDGPAVRARVQAQLHHVLDQAALPWQAIHGQQAERTANALKALQAVLALPAR